MACEAEQHLWLWAGYKGKKMSASELNNLDAKAGVCVCVCMWCAKTAASAATTGKFVPLGCKRARGTLKHTKLSLLGAERQRKASAPPSVRVVFALRQQKRQRWNCNYVSSARNSFTAALSERQLCGVKPQLRKQAFDATLHLYRPIATPQEWTHTTSAQLMPPSNEKKLFLFTQLKWVFDGVLIKAINAAERLANFKLNFANN